MPNGNKRGSSRDRRARKLWLVSEESGWGGDGETVPCWECNVLLEVEDIFADRIIPCIDGGRYTRDNIAPHCELCSHKQGQRIMRERMAQKSKLVLF